MEEFRADKGVEGSGECDIMGCVCQIGSKSSLWACRRVERALQFLPTSTEEMTNAHLDHIDSQWFPDCSDLNLKYKYSSGEIERKCTFLYYSVFFFFFASQNFIKVAISDRLAPDVQYVTCIKNFKRVCTCLLWEIFQYCTNACLTMLCSRYSQR